MKIIPALLALTGKTIDELMEQLTLPLYMYSHLKNERKPLMYLIHVHDDQMANRKAHHITRMENGELKLLIKKLQNELRKKCGEESYIRTEAYVIYGNHALLVPAQIIKAVTGIDTGYVAVTETYVESLEEVKKRLKAKTLA